MSDNYSIHPSIYYIYNCYNLIIKIRTQITMGFCKLSACEPWWCTALFLHKRAPEYKQIYDKTVKKTANDRLNNVIFCYLYNFIFTDYMMALYRNLEQTGPPPSTGIHINH